jgi:hypothetical protein
MTEANVFTFWAKYGNKYMYKSYNPLQIP